MKKTIVIMGVFVLSLATLSVNAQQTTTWDAKKNPTVDSLTSGYESKLLAPPKPMTTEQVFPVVGQYESSANTDAASVKITLDPENKGVVWVEGLPQGKVKAMLRKSPAVYKIPVQKTEDGKDVSEGTLIYDKETNSLLICIGKPFNAADPATAFSAPTEQPAVTEEKTAVAKNGKNKSAAKIKKADEPKPWMYAGTKVDKGTVLN
jgi:hypothetical protein